MALTIINEKENNMRKFRASTLDLKEVPREEEKAFLDKYHYQGYKASSHCYGLYDGDELIELMSFCRPRYNKKFDWELLRLCTKEDCQVYGGASKLYKSRPEGSCVSYCNESKFTGKVYEALGMLKRNVCHSYHYEKDGKSYHRSNFQKWKLIQMYPQYEYLSEREIMKKLGYTRVEENQATWVSSEEYKYYIYKIEIGKYSYIGQHAYIQGREDNYMGSGSILKRVQKKYNTLGTKTILLDNLSREEADLKEIELIALDKENNKYNINIQKGGQNYKVHACGTTGNYGANKGMHHSEDTLKKMSDASKKHWQDITYREKVLESRKEYFQGHSAWNKGKHVEYSEEGLKSQLASKERKMQRFREELSKSGLVSVKDLMKETGLSRAKVLKRYNTFEYYIGKQKFLVVKRGEEPHFIENRGKWSRK